MLGGGGSFTVSGIPIFNVKDYGAVGDGSNDDTSAINAAIAAFNNVSPAVPMYFPTGQYKITSDLTTITSSGMIFGAGVIPGQDTGAGRLGSTVIQYDTGTGTAFTITSADLLIEDLTIRNNNATTPTAGAGIAYTRAATIDQKGVLDLTNVMVDGFYDGVDQQGGTFWTFLKCRFFNAVRYGIRIRNISNADWGMWAITNCFFLNYDRSYVTAAMIRLESSGGGKITACNFVSTIGSTDRYLDIVGDGSTSSLVVSNCQLEAYGIDAIRSTGMWKYQIFSNLEMALYSPSSGYAFNLAGGSDVIINQIAFNTNVTPAPAKAINSSSMTRLVVGGECTNNGYTSIT
jgi:hypothetical protein